jgi:putative oxidoreductase
VSYGLLLLRIVLGLTMAGHGTQKLFGWFGGPGLKGTAGFFTSLGFRGGAALALLAAVAETSGVLLALGLITPLATFGISIVMLNAIGSVHWKNGFWNGNGGFEFNLLILTSAVAIAAIGPGRFSLDRALGWDDNLSGLWWGVGVLAGAIVVSALTLTVGRTRQASQEQPASS